MAVPVSELKKSNIIPKIRQCLGLKILLLLLSSIDYDSIPMRFLCELSTKNYCVQLLEGCTCGHLVYLPTLPPANIICLVIYGNLVGSGSQSGSLGVANAFQ